MKQRGGLLLSTLQRSYQLAGVNIVMAKHFDGWVLGVPVVIFVIFYLLTH